MGTTLPTQFLFIIPISIPTSYYSTSSTTPKMSTTVHVKGISHETTEKEVKDFFSFCGKINSISVTPESDAPDAQISSPRFHCKHPRRCRFQGRCCRLLLGSR